MYGVLCRLAIDGVLEMRRRGLPEGYVQECIRSHHQHIVRRTLLWTFTCIGLSVGIIRARCRNS